MCFIRTKRLPDESKKGSVSILDHLIFYLGEVNCQTTPHYKPRQVEAAYIECGNSAAAMQVKPNTHLQLNRMQFSLNPFSCNSANE